MKCEHCKRELIVDEKMIQVLKIDKETKVFRWGFICEGCQLINDI